MDAQKVGRRIQKVRRACGLTQAEFAQMVDLSTKQQLFSAGNAWVKPQCQQNPFPFRRAIEQDFPL